MRQIPRYAIIGNGRVAKHLLHYFKLVNTECKHWSYKSHTESELHHIVNQSDIILILIKDDEIENFITNNLSNINKTLIHFSGSLHTELATGIHPLMSFGEELYEIDTYKNINFVIDDKKFDFKSYFPIMDNKYYYINKDLKAYYHALCVMSGNFSSILWSKLFDELEKMNIPKEAAYPYLDSITSNLKLNHKDTLTGPFIRNDVKTIEKNLNSLSGDKYLAIYQTFLKLFNSKDKNEYK